MRKIAILLAALSIQAALFASSTTLSFGLTGGYSQVNNGTGTIGVNATAQYVADISNRFGVGLGTHIDASFGLNKPDIPFSFGFILGPGFDIRLGTQHAINITVGPSLIAETGKRYSLAGFGIGLDAMYTFFFDETRTLGISAGVSVYPQFLVTGNRDFSIAATGYVGITWHMRGYSLNPLHLAPLGYLILTD